jgi:fatty-acyl-CoA synthase
MELHYSTIYERVADVLPDAPALIHGDLVRSWAEFDDRAARLASTFLAGGLRHDAKVGIYLYNCNEWLEACHGALKMRGVPVNVNYRYLDEELIYLLTDSDSEALVYHASFAERVARIRDRLPLIRRFLQVDDENGQVPVPDWADDYERAIAGYGPAPRIARSEDDVMFTYTGGTTGMPKGVINPMGLAARSAVTFARGGLAIPDWPTEFNPEFAVELARRGDTPITSPLVPLMHSSGLGFSALPTLFCGGCVVTMTARGLDSAEVWETVGRQRITTLVVAGDAIARPLLHELKVAQGQARPYDLSSLRVIMSAGVAWSANTKIAMLEFMPSAVLQDACGSTEGGIGFRVMRRGDAATTNSFVPVPGLKVLRPDGTEVEAGTGERGRIATPSSTLGYYKDPEKTAGIYREIDGVTYAMAGDFALREADGSVVLLGRGSTVINTGGEKVFPEEVEEVVKTFAGVSDCLVTAAPHARWGNQVIAVASLYVPHSATEEEIIGHVRSRLADYKAPKRIIFVAKVPRHANGKPDLKGAKRIAAEVVAGQSSLAEP